MELIFLIVVLLIMASFGFLMPSLRRYNSLVVFGFWSLVVSGIAFGYTWINDREMLLQETVTGRSVKFKKAFDGHFYILARSPSGSVIRFLFDTGASDIVLTPKDAQKLGFKIDSLVYDKSYHTSNGIIQAASVVIPRLKIGGVIVSNISASVSSVPSPYSLMGMSFIENFAFTINQDSLELFLE